MFDPEQRERMKLVLSELPERESSILGMLFGVEKGLEATEEEICEKYGLTKEELQPIVAKSLRKLPSRSRHLRAFLEGTRRKDKSE